LAAADVTLTASGKIWVQNSGGNSGDPDARAGITVGPNTLTLVTTGDPTEIIVNARAENGSGGFTTGEAMLDEAVITGIDGSDALVAEGSTINSCDIATGVCGMAPPPVITGFLGTPDVVGGSATVSDDHSFITVNSSRAIINWSDAQTDFLPSAHFAEFSGAGDYTVLNRVLATDQTQAIQLNGRIDSLVGDAAVAARSGSTRHPASWSDRLRGSMSAPCCLALARSATATSSPAATASPSAAKTATRRLLSPRVPSSLLAIATAISR
jgi:hypothetical protein